MTAALFMTGCGNSGEQTTEEQFSNSENAETTRQSSKAQDSEEQIPQEENQITGVDIDIDKSGRLYQLEDSVEGEVIATMKTNKGDIVLRIFPDKAPKAAENFITHAKEGYYNGVIFHRVIKDFMIQGGDPQGTGTGGESIWGTEFPNEMSSGLRSFRGALCMANAGLDTNGSQFYIVQNNKVDDMQRQYLEELKNIHESDISLETANSNPLLVQYAKTVISKNSDKIKSDDDVDKVLKEQNVKVKDIFPNAVIDEYLTNGGYPSLDYGYTVFGQVKSGMEVVDAIAAVETSSDDKPVENIVINSIEIE